MISGCTYETTFSYGPDHERWRSCLPDDGDTVRTVLYGGDYERVVVGDTVRELGLFIVVEINRLYVRPKMKMMRKALLLLSMMLLAVLPSQAQEAYRPLLKDGKVWKELLYSPTPEIEWTKYISGDTLIDGKTYYKMYRRGVSRYENELEGAVEKIYPDEFFIAHTDLSDGKNFDINARDYHGTRVKPSDETYSTNNYICCNVCDGWLKMQEHDSTLSGNMSETGCTFEGNVIIHSYGSRHSIDKNVVNSSYHPYNRGIPIVYDNQGYIDANGMVYSAIDYNKKLGIVSYPV